MLPAQIEGIPLRRDASRDTDRSRIRQQQPVDELEDGALACAAPAHQSDGLSAFDGEVHALQDAAASRAPGSPSNAISAGRLMAPGRLSERCRRDRRLRSGTVRRSVAEVEAAVADREAAFAANAKAMRVIENHHLIPARP